MEMPYTTPVKEEYRAVIALFLVWLAAAPSPASNAALSAEAATEAAIARVRSVDPHQPVHTIRTLDGMVAASLAPRKFTLRMLEFFALAALFL